MKILAFVDLHGDYKELTNLKRKALENDVDVVICAGDMTIFGSDEEKIMKSISGFKLPVFIVHGNHEDADSLHSICDKHENLIFIHCASFRIDNYIFFGYGGGGFSKRDEGFKMMSKNFSSDIKKDDKKILILHGPPYGTNADYTNGIHVGNKDYMDFIKNEKIDLVVSGHIHETAGTNQKMGSSRIINPGKKGKIIEL